MRHLLIVLATVFCLGCEDFADVGENKRKPLAPPGILAPEETQIEDVKPAAGQPQQPAPRQQRTGSSVIGKTTAEVVDVRKVRENPNIRAVGDRKIPIADPISQAGSAYFIAVSKTSTLGLQRSIQLYQATNNKYPTYDEFMRMMKENRVEFAKLRPYELYGYDEESGEILVLEDTQKKAELYEAVGLDADGN